MDDMTKQVVENEIEKELRKPFGIEELEWVVSSTWANGSKGIIAPYMSARAVMNRLDSVFGINGWSASYRVMDNLGVICTLTVKIGGEWIDKQDGSGFTKVEPLKGGISGALKRAASCFGIGRYLYGLPTVFVDLEDKKFKGKVVGLPDEFVPEDERQGLSEVKIEYPSSSGYHKSAPKNPAPKGELTEEVKAAMEYVVHDDKYNTGKKMGDVWNNSLKFLAKSSDPAQANAAKIVAQYKGVSI